MAGSDDARLAAELRAIRDGVRELALEEGPKKPPAPPRTREPELGPREAEPPKEPPPSRPDGKSVNLTWDMSRSLEGGFWPRLGRRLIAPFVAAQTAWNSRQVQLDNEVLEYIDRRLADTHAHYDRVLGIHGRHMQDIDERHLILQEELVAHVHDLVKRIDLVLGEAEKGRLSLEFALREVRGRLARLEERLDRG